MRSEKQISASRLNGKKSQGPLTARGKDHIRRNALKHGSTAQLTVWSNENAAHFQDLLHALLLRFQPTNDVEFLCVEEMAMARWRLRRVVGVETAAGNENVAASNAKGAAATLTAFAAAQPTQHLLTTLRHHEAAYARAYQRAYRHLQQLREDEREERSAA